MKKQKGITLIALVITIIVLLILAGVSISLIVGENGVLNQASTSVVKTREAESREEVEVAWASMETEYLGEWAKDTSKLKTDEYIENTLKKYLAGTGEIVEGTFKHENDTYTFTYKPYDDDLSYEITISANGKVNIVGAPSISEKPGESEIPKEGATLLSEITSANYGDYVNYNKNLGLTLNLEGESTTHKTDWRIFYKDTELDRVYLIASDYVPNTSSLLKASEAGMTESGDYSLCWATAPSKLSTVNRQDSIFGITGSSYQLNSEYERSRCVSMLLDTAHWTNFVDTSVSDFAIGGPTIEMFANSWKDKSNEEMSYTINSRGYNINWSPTKNIGSEENLYFPSHSNEVGSEGVIAYWLASPSSWDTTGSVLAVWTNSERGYKGISFYSRGSGNVSVRPVVALKPGMSGTKDVNGIWQLGE